METRIPVEWVDEQLGGREEEVDGGKADHLGGGRIQINWFGIGVAILIVALQHGDM